MSITTHKIQVAEITDTGGQMYGYHYHKQGKAKRLQTFVGKLQ